METGKIDIMPLITSKIPLKDIDLGFKTLLKGDELCVIIQP
jgi:Zn-dependent alcohol dehydrogenase